MSHGCLLSLKKAGADKAEEDDTKPICFVSVSSKRFSAPRVEDTTQQLATPFVVDVTTRRYLIGQDGLQSTLTSQLTKLAASILVTNVLKLFYEMSNRLASCRRSLLFFNRRRKCIFYGLER
jgi:hypothetical protein